VLVVVVACVLAVSLAAGTLSGADSPTREGTGGDGDSAKVEGPGEHPSAGGSNGFVSDAETERTKQSGDYRPPISGLCVPFLRTPLFLGLVAGVVVVGGYAVSKRLDRVAAALVFPVFGTILLPLYGMFTQCGGSQSVPDSAVKTLRFAAGETGKAGSEVASTATRTLSVPALVGALGVALAIVAAAFLLRTGDDEAAEDAGADRVKRDDEAATEPGNGDWAAAQSAAGDAADRIAAGADVDNEVYRAWREMTDHVALPAPETSTPAEVAETARNAGVSPERVDALTDLFREVRYGGADATEDREQRALDALRAIEADDD
jgi:hypothetical protein